jgi:hypothetical protein
MKSRNLFLALTLGAALAGGAVVSQESHPAARTTPAFDQIKSLAGQWEGTDEEGHKVALTYEITSNGSVVMERLDTNSHAEPMTMVTMYSLEGNRINATHYCGIGNQPTMQTAPSPEANGKYDFRFVRLSGYSKPDEGHMAELIVTVSDANHLSQTWNFDDHGKTISRTFNLIRKA